MTSGDTSQYDASSIQSLTGREHVRKRPGMYFGGTDQQALHNVIKELVEISITQVINGNGTEVIVVLNDNAQVTVQDNSAGIPTEPYLDTSKLTHICTQVGSRNDDHNSMIGWGLGIAAVNAISAYFKVEVKYNGYLWKQVFSEGIATTDLQQIRRLNSAETTCTSITFQPDFTIFEQNEFDYSTLLRQFQDYAYMVPNLKIAFEDKRTNTKENTTTIIHYSNGLADYVKFLNRDFIPLHEPIHIQESVIVNDKHDEPKFEVKVDIALQYCSAPQYLVLTYVNAEEMGIESNHSQEFLGQLEFALEDIAQLQKSTSKSSYHRFSRQDIMHGLTAVINIWHPHPNFAGCIRYELNNPSAEHAITSIMEDFGEKYADKLEAVVKHCINNRKLREERRFGKQ